MSRTYGKAQDLIDFTRASSGTALRRVKYGAELVTNGTFDTTTTGWSAYRNAILSVNDSKLRITEGVDGGSGVASQLLTFEIGKLYRIRVDIPAKTTSFAIVRISSGADATEDTYYVNDVSVSSTYYEQIWVATVSSAYIVLQVNGSSEVAGDYVEFDNVSVKEVTFDTSDGDLVLFNHPANIPRIEYDANGNLLGLLVEESRTNNIQYSEDFTHSYWIKTGVTVTENYAVGPDGVAGSASRLLGTEGNLYALAASIGTEQTISFFVKSNGNGLDTFKLRLGASESQTFTATDEWVRYVFTATPSTTIAGIRTAGATPNDIQIYGAQVE